MIGIDTNVLVRFLVQDDLVQSAVATELIEQRLTPRNPGFVSTVAITEASWILARSYRLDNKRVAAVIEAILAADRLVVEHEQAVFTAMIELRNGRGSFADALIGSLGAASGCEYTATFDKRALRLPNFRPA